MSAAQSGQVGLAGAIAVAIAPPTSNPPLLTEAQKFEQTLLGPFQIPGSILSNLAINGYSTLDDLAYFGHKYFEYFCSVNIRQYLNRGGANYSDKVIKILQGMVWRASDMNRLNHPLLVNTNLTRDESNEWYFEAVFEVAKLKKEFDIEYPGNLVYA